MFPTFHVFYVIELTRRSLNVDMLNYVSGKHDPKKIVIGFLRTQIHCLFLYIYTFV